MTPHDPRVLLVAEGSGGHLIPALQVGDELARGGAQVKVWYAQRRQTESLTQALVQESAQPTMTVEPVPVQAPLSVSNRLRTAGGLWWNSQRCFRTFRPTVVAGFGGWISVPVVLAARQRRIPCLLHEQNVQMGRTNRLLSRAVNRVAVSFPETGRRLRGTPSVVTGLPTRQALGSCVRRQAADLLECDPGSPTLLILGGSQGAAAINRLLIRTLPSLTLTERRAWQVIHLTGAADEIGVGIAYASRGMRALVKPFLTQMHAAYALADVVISRAGASTIAELARCGRPAILIPYPLADGHQRANARMVESVGGGVMLEEADATPERFLGILRRLLRDPVRRGHMAVRIHTLAVPDATARLTKAITDLGSGFSLTPSSVSEG